MLDQNFNNLTGKVLVATPFAMEGNVFHKSMIYVIQHSETGSVGLIFNRPVTNLPADTLLKKIENDLLLPDLGLEVHVGGPVEPERGFFLHSMDYDKNLLFKPTNNTVAVSSNTDIINDISEGKGPEHILFTIGYTGWAAGQMEFELENNLWIIAEPDMELIFSDNSNLKWDIAMATMGLAPSEFVPNIGTA